MTGAAKRTAEDEPSGRRTRSAKAAKTEGSSPRKGGKKGPKTSLGASSFKSRALPLHVNFTHTPPAIPDSETVNATSADPGFIGTTALVPTVFNTGSYGWKGNKRVTIELQNGESGEKEKVHVMLTINATVMGSKNAKDDDGVEGEHENADPAEHVEGAEAEVEKPEGEPTDKASAAEESKAEGGEKDVEMAAAEDQKAETEEKEKVE